MRNTIVRLRISLRMYAMAVRREQDVLTANRCISLKRLMLSPGCFALNAEAV